MNILDVRGLDGSLPEAELLKGFAWENGYGVTRDRKRALEHYLKAAEMGHVLAQYSAGNIYFRGIELIQSTDGLPTGSAEEIQQAIKWFGQAADRRYGPAAYALHLIYREGIGVAADEVRGQEFLEVAAAAGQDLAIYLLGKKLRGQWTFLEPWHFTNRLLPWGRHPHLPGWP